MPSAVGRASQFREESLARWETLLRRIFPSGIPTQCRWDDIDVIIKVLNTVGGVELTNHTFVPHGGGLDLTGVERSAEPDCIELQYGRGRGGDIMKPDGLFFESFGDDNLEWAYFRLEAKPLEPSGVYERLFSDMAEEVTHLGGGEYAPRSLWDQGHFGYDERGNEIPLPSETKPVFRNFKGAFVIFAKGSIYNNTPSTYDARHSKMTGQQFRRHIEDAIKYLEEKGQKADDHASS